MRTRALPQDRQVDQPLRRGLRLLSCAVTLAVVSGSFMVTPVFADGVPDEQSFLNSVDPSASQAPPSFVPPQQMQPGFNPNMPPYNPGAMPPYPVGAQQPGFQQQPQQPQQQQQMQQPVSGAANVLPAAFLGKWSVAGNCTKLEARPDLMERAEAGFRQESTDTWTVKGKPGKYVLAHPSGSEKVEVGPGNADTVFFNYRQKPAKNGAQTTNAVVLKLQPDGKAFSGILRVTVTHPNEDITRAQATYSLTGTRL